MTDSKIKFHNCTLFYYELSSQLYSIHNAQHFQRSKKSLFNFAEVFQVLNND